MYIFSQFPVMPFYVFHDHNRIIQQEPQCQDDRCQSNDIEVYTEHTHQGDGGSIDQRNGYKDYQYLPERCQKEENHDRRHDDRITEGFKHIACTLFYGLFLRITDFKVNIWILCFNISNNMFYFVYGLDNISRDRTLYGQSDRRFSISIIGSRVFIMSKIDLSYIGKFYIRGKHQSFKRRNFVSLPL